MQPTVKAQRVLVEGFSKNYTPIRIKGDYERGSIISVTITGTNGEYCTAE